MNIMQNPSNQTHIDNYIYYITSDRDFNDVDFKAIKIGSTCNPVARFLTYKTHHYNAPMIKKLYKVDFNCYSLDNLIKKDFDNFRRYGEPKAGIEFYHPSLTPQKLEEYFNSKNISFKEINFDDLEYDSVNRPNRNDYDFVHNEDMTKINFNCKVPRNYQLPIIDKIVTHYQANKLGKLILACGVGKTLTSYWALDKMGHKKILFMVPSLYLLSQVVDVYLSQSMNEGKKLNFLIVGSDVELNENIFEQKDISIIKKSLTHQNDTYKIKQFIENNDKFIIFSTYQSSLSLNSYKFDFVIFDEAHKTATQSDKTTGFNNFVVNHKDSKKMFMTATEKICNIKNDDIDETMSMDNKDLYGDTIVRMNIREAINAKALCDYQIIIHQDDVRQLLTQDKITKLQTKHKGTLMSNKIVEYYCKALIMKKIIQTYNVKRIITKHTRVEYAKQFSKILKNIFAKDDTDIDVFMLDGLTKMEQRKKAINKFRKSDLAIICQAKVLSEGVDIPECDTVIMIDDVESTIDIIQFMLRSFRTLHGKERAYVILPMLMDGQSDIINKKAEYNNVRIILRAMLYEDDKIAQYFKEYDFGNKNKANNMLSEELINFKNISDVNPFIDLVKDINKISPETFDKAKEYVRGLGLKSIKEYREWCKNRTDHFNIPEKPDQVYNTLGWNGWTDWLNHKILELKDLRKSIEIENNLRKLKDCQLIDTKSEYDNWAKANGYMICEDLEEYFGFSNYKWLFGLGDYMEWDELCQVCRKFYSKNSNKSMHGSDYYKELMNEYNIPTDPEIYYKEFVTYNDLFGIIFDY